MVIVFREGIHSSEKKFNFFTILSVSFSLTDDNFYEGQRRDTIRFEFMSCDFVISLCPLMILYKLMYLREKRIVLFLLCVGKNERYIVLFLIDLSKREMNQNLLKNILCLLYTSPSPRDRTRSRMPSSA